MPILIFSLGVLANSLLVVKAMREPTEKKVVSNLENHVSKLSFLFDFIMVKVQLSYVL